MLHPWEVAQLKLKRRWAPSLELLLLEPSWPQEAIKSLLNHGSPLQANSSCPPMRPAREQAQGSVVRWPWEA